MLLIGFFDLHFMLLRLCLSYHHGQWYNVPHLKFLYIEWLSNFTHIIEEYSSNYQSNSFKYVKKVGHMIPFFYVDLVFRFKGCSREMGLHMDTGGQTIKNKQGFYKFKSLLCLTKLIFSSDFLVLKNWCVWVSLKNFFNIFSIWKMLLMAS